MDAINLLRVVVTVFSFAAFMGVLVYALHPRNARRFGEAARLALDDDGTLSPTPSPSPTPRSTPRAPEGEGAKVGQGFAKRERQ